MRSKWLHIAFEITTWFILMALLIVSLAFTENQRKKELCSKIIVNISDSIQNHFIDSDDVLQNLSFKNYKLLNQAINSIPLENIEQDLKRISVIKNVDVYTTLDGILYIRLIQRTPILRVINYNYESYYIDDEGTLFPLSKKYTARVLVANGNINEPYSLYANMKAYDADKTNGIKRISMLDDLYYLAKVIYNDSLLYPLIEQVYVNDENYFELIPKIDDVVIVFGDTTNMLEKVKKLKTFYTQVLNKNTWNSFSVVNLIYKNQIVCKKRNIE